MSVVGTLPIAICATLLISAGGAVADQNDTRLNELFAIIAQVEHQRVSAEVEQQIWEIWLSHEDDGIEARLAAGVTAMNHDPRLAFNILTELTEEVPDFAEAWNKRATLYYLLGDYAASHSDILRTLELEPRHFGALSGLGLVHLALGQYVEAITAFEGVLRVHPQSKAAQDNIDKINRHLRRQAI
jgi:tetratricopeptide (TPR) repeat protein